MNKGKLFSIKDKKSGLVVAHGDSFKVTDVTCKVREGGRQRVIKDKRKNVHAFLIATYAGECNFDTGEMTELYYDPYTLDAFINRATGKVATEADTVWFKDGKAYIYIK
ncbi:hypothetical protein [Bacillus sp. AG4(2022)]|uniref:hypothetical protein n=1 Tax=Bacillus sp. AG4(2022) TaxID=2962594 RepID=UPI0028826147|nr:hypothetical protein [Bacillus sp. AG4(2022)]MDT0160444.1 hypothetical protein [Bacillus sp. AG4(2022)]